MTPSRSLVFILIFVSLFYLIASHEEDDSFPEEIGDPPENTIKRIAIIGAGVGGGSAAHYLKENLNLGKIAHRMTIFEAQDHAGGRVDYRDVDGIRVEVGGSIILGENFHQRNFSYFYNMTEIDVKEDGGLIGIWNGKEFVFRESPWKILTIASALWRWGYSSLMAVDRISGEMKHRWMQVYDHLKNKRSFESVTEMYQTLHLINMTTIPYKKYLLDQGVDELYVDEMVTILTRINYGQNTSMHALGGAISTVTRSDKFLQVEEGWRTLVERVIQGSGADLKLKSRVKSIELVHSAKGQVGYKLKWESGNTIQEGHFDAVIIASPLEDAEIELIGLDDIFKLKKRPWQTTHVTLVQGQLNKNYFGKDISHENFPETIGTTENDAIPFSSISIKAAGKSGVPIWKIFSREPMTDKLLDEIFPKRTFLEKLSWKAYPKLVPTSDFPPFKLNSGLFYLNAIEGAFSVMEGEAVSGHNIANLVLADWTNSEQKLGTSTSKLKTGRKDEL
eukprot:TRINITY_DN4713_c0_g1_i1.p1 TRINITY_DN4713_c0_g1~~TRINITY_DN4713_c0_g1_i1.p1  ORF type:complete len:505 (-),score=164.82 TRINITY_DN4713_c0_g1_i1:23-1537(-)